jgi:hypothetical protein
VNSDVAIEKSKKSIGVKLDPQIYKSMAKGRAAGQQKSWMSLSPQPPAPTSI